MGDLITRKYELSIWKDVLDNSEGIPFFREEKIAVIGASELDSPCAASNIELTLSINEENSLSFEIYSKYFDENLNEYIENPYYDKIYNEAHLKLKYNEEWYDFVIKNVDETNIEYKKTITATDYFVQELSKNGYNLEFNSELNNNTGSAQDLIEKIIEGTDWEVYQDSDVVRQYIEEPLYRYMIQENQTIECFNCLTGESKTLIQGQVIYIFYSCVQSKTNPVQFLYDEEQLYPVNEEGVIVDNDIYNFYSNNFAYNSEKLKGVDTGHRGKRLARSAMTEWDDKNQKTVTIYKSKTEGDNKDYYCYTDVEYITQDYVQNIFTCGENFSADSNEWYCLLGTNLETETNFTSNFPEKIKDIYTWLDEAKSCIVFKKIKEASPILENNFDTTAYARTNCLKDNLTAYMVQSSDSDNQGYLDIPQGTGFTLRCSSNELNFRIHYYKETIVKNETTDEEGNISETETVEVVDKILGIFDFTNSSKVKDSDGNTLYQAQLEIASPISYEDIDYYYVEACLNSTSQEVKVTKLLLFLTEYFDKSSTEKVLIVPGEIIEVDDDFIGATVKTKYFIYEKGSNPEGHGVDSTDGYEIKYDDSYTKIRSIEGSETNRFDLIQSVNEAFECWTTFDIERNMDGSILLEDKYILQSEYGDIYNNATLYYKDENGDYSTVSNDTEPYLKIKRRKKQIKISEEIGKELSYGFYYGINLNSAQRTIASEELVTKLIVPNNNNEYGVNGYCSISRASENIAKANFLINFDYFVNMGILNKETVYNDLYGTENSNGIAYLTKYGEYNDEINEIYDGEYGLTARYAKRASLEANYQTLKEFKSSAEKQTEELYAQIYKEYDLDLKNRPTDKIDENIKWDIYDAEAQGEIEAVLQQIQAWTTKSKEFFKAEIEYNENENRIKLAEEKIEKIQSKITALDKVFYQKYQNYLKEGTWNSDDYYDDNLYYYDALSSLYVSKSPEVSYSIEVVDIGVLEDFDFFNFHIGDRTFVYDPTIFGEIKEEVVITEITYNLEDPTSNSYTIQNYRTEFADLFSKFAAATTQVELKQGTWEKGASVLSGTGTFNTEILQESLQLGGDFYNVALGGIYLTSEGLIISPRDATPYIVQGGEDNSD